jgi:hypothetical protein
MEPPSLGDLRHVTPYVAPSGPFSSQCGRLLAPDAANGSRRRSSPSSSVVVGIRTVGRAGLSTYASGGRGRTSMPELGHIGLAKPAW